MNGHVPTAAVGRLRTGFARLATTGVLFLRPLKSSQRSRKGEKPSRGWTTVRSFPALTVAVGLLLAGCVKTTPDEPDPVPLDGDAALAFVAGLISNEDGSPRYRVPGTDGHDQAANWLWGQMQVTGWKASWQNFTGADYIPMDKGSVAFYYENAGYCSDDEQARLATLSFHNLVATLPADPPSDLTVYLGAHWESKRFASQDPDTALRDQPVLGANDGASGVGVLLQLMHHVQGHEVALPFNLVVAFFDGEDGFEDCHPLAGSLHFVQQLPPGPESSKPTRRMLLLDMVGDADARFVREGNSMNCDPRLVDLLHDHAPAVGLAANFPNVTRSVADDHIPFIEAGIPAADLIDFGRGFPPYWHTTHDTLDKLDAGMLGRVGDLVLAVLTDPAFTQDWPDLC